MTKDYLKNNTFVKTILMLLVIFGHACAFWSGHWFTEDPAIQSTLLDILYSWVNAFHIYAFALISGYTFAFKRLAGGYDKYLPFLKTKALRLLVPYAFTALVWVAPLSAYFMHWDIQYLFQKYVLGINPSQLWFLLMLFDVFAIVWPLWNLFRDRPVLGYAIVLGFYVVGVFGDRVLPNVFCIWKACQYIPFFFIGIRIRVKEEAQKKTVTETLPWFVWLVLYMIVFVLFLYAGDKSGMVWNAAERAVGFVLHVLGALAAFTTLHAIAPLFQWKSSRFFNALALSSMPMYLFHQQIIYFTITWLNGRVKPIVNAGINFLAAAVLSFLLSRLLMRWKVTRFLIGEK